MIGVESLSFAYRQDLGVVLNDFTHQFSPGSVTAITGPSGCGKSTLLYILGLMLQPTSGRVMLGGQNTVDLSDYARSCLRASMIGFVFQDAILDPSRTILENVLEAGIYADLDPHDSRERALQLLSAFGVDRRADRRPGEISGGQAQRVALCRALLKHPAVILADEPTGNLDRTSGQTVWEALQRAAVEGATVVIATHDQALVQAADEAVLL